MNACSARRVICWGLTCERVIVFIASSRPMLSTTLWLVIRRTLQKSLRWQISLVETVNCVGLRYESHFSPGSYNQSIYIN